LLEEVSRVAATGRIAALGDSLVLDLHGASLRAGLEDFGTRLRFFEIPRGEAAKTLSVVENTCAGLAEWGFERGDVIVGFGGGATTDVAGFIASILARGVRYASLATTLLAQVDAAIGGKTGVNLAQGKNLLGTFHQPMAVGCDTSFLTTLPLREYRAGLAEVVKTAWIGDPELLELLEEDPPKTPQHVLLPEIVRRCVAVKANIVAEDEKEEGRRAVLNFGHTLGHAIEWEAHGRVLHGEAVALGLLAAIHLSVASGRCGPELLARMKTLLEKLELPVRDPDLDVHAVLARTRHDKKRSGARDRYQLTEGVGQVSVAQDLPEDAPRKALEFLRR
jgi:3-dehydroquinate synthase